MHNSLFYIKKITKKYLYGQISLILGLSIVLVLISYTNYHESFDKFHNKEGEVIRILNHEDESRTLALTDNKVKENLKANFPYAVTQFYFSPIDENLEYNNEKINANKVILADEEFFNVFNFELKEGNLNNFENKKNQIVITESFSKKIFSNKENKIGQILNLKVETQIIPVEVLAILKDTPSNSSLDFNIILSGETSGFWKESFKYPVFNTFVKISEKNEKEKIKNYLEENKSDKFGNYSIQEIGEIHLSSNVQFETFDKFEKKYLQIFKYISILIIILSLFNFINLFYSESIIGLKQITTRKILGASKWTIYKIHLKELNICLTNTSIITLVIIGFFQRLLIENFNFAPLDYLNSTYTLIIFIFTLIITYISIFLISNSIYKNKNTSGLKGSFKTEGNKQFGIRNILLSMQISISIFSLIYAIIISEQVRLIQNSDFGFNYKDVITLKRPDDISLEKWKTFEEELLKDPYIKSIGKSVFPPIGEYNTLTLKDNQGDRREFSWMGVDVNFFNTLDIEIIHGRNFLDSDINALIINEAAMDELGGLSEIYNNYEFRNRKFNIIGVISDYNFNSIKEKATPTMFSLNNIMALRNLNIKFEEGKHYQILPRIKEVANKVGINPNFNYKFLDEEFKSYLIKEELNTNFIVKIFSISSLIIVIFGLIGFQNQIFRLKKKEICIRKLLGASYLENLIFLVKFYIIPSTVGILIVILTTYRLMKTWTQQFIIPLEFNIFYFILPILIILIIVLITSIGYITKVQHLKPIKYLKD